MTEPARTRTGTIYDIGYQHYDGPRLGRGYAIGSLFVHGIAATYAVGRGFKAGVLPLALSAAAILPAAIQALATAYTDGQIELFTYSNYFTSVSMVFAFFCAARAPELMSSDQRTRTLVLYFARALHRSDYVVAKVLALAISILFLTLTPLLILFAGHVFTSTDLWSGFLDEAHALPPIFLSSAVMALLMASISAAIASLTPRRNLAAAGVLGYFMLSRAVAEILTDALEGSWVPWLRLLDPLRVLGGFADWVFGAEQGLSPSLRDGLPAGRYVVTALLYVALGISVLLARYRKVAT